MSAAKTAAKTAAKAHAVTVTAPVRADLAGGTLDIWPLGLFHPGSSTVATALSLRVAVTCAPAEAPGTLTLVSGDLGKRRSAPFDREARARRGPLELVERLAQRLAPDEGATIETLSPVRAGSGLGTSSALGVAVAVALTRLRGETPRAETIVPIVRDAEAQVLGIPTGTQDHLAAWHGGLVALEHRAGGAEVHVLDGALQAALAQRLLMVDSGEGRSSGPSNWDMIRRRIDGEPEAALALSRVARAGTRAVEALAKHDWRALGAAMTADLRARMEWSPLVMTERLTAIFDAAGLAGALGAKVCGAGGGGYAAILVDESKRARVVAAIREAGGLPSEARPDPSGVRTVRTVSARRVRRV